MNKKIINFYGMYQIDLFAVQFVHYDDEFEQLHIVMHGKASIHIPYKNIGMNDAVKAQLMKTFESVNEEIIED